MIGKDATPATPKTGYEIKGDTDIPYFGFKATTPPSGAAKIEGTIVLDTGTTANQLDSADARIEGATVVLLTQTLTAISYLLVLPKSPWPMGNIPLQLWMAANVTG